MMPNIFTLRGISKSKIIHEEFMPEIEKFVKKYRGKIPLFHSAGIEKI